MVRMPLPAPCSNANKAAAGAPSTSSAPTPKGVGERGQACRQQGVYVAQHAELQHACCHLRGADERARRDRGPPTSRRWPAADAAGGAAMAVLVNQVAAKTKARMAALSCRRGGGLWATAD